MSTTIYLEHNQLGAAERLIRAGFPNYSGKKVKVTIHEANMSLHSYWEGGSRDYFALVDLANGQIKPIPQNGTMFDRRDISWQMVPGVAVLEHTINQGKDLGITIHLHPANAQSIALPKQTELRWSEQVVLCAARSLKSSYAGVKNYRLVESLRSTGITEDEYNTAKGSCIDSGLLSKIGAITPAGKNALESAMGGWGQLHQLRRKDNV